MLSILSLTATPIDAIRRDKNGAHSAGGEESDCCWTHVVSERGRSRTVSTFCAFSWQVTRRHSVSSSVILFPRTPERLSDPGKNLSGISEKEFRNLEKSIGLICFPSDFEPETSRVTPACGTRLLGRIRWGAFAIGRFGDQRSLQKIKSSDRTHVRTQRKLLRGYSGRPANRSDC